MIIVSSMMRADLRSRPAALMREEEERRFILHAEERFGLLNFDKSVCLDGDGLIKFFCLSLKKFVDVVLVLNKRSIAITEYMGAKLE